MAVDVNKFMELLTEWKAALPPVEHKPLSSRAITAFEAIQDRGTVSHIVLWRAIYTQMRAPKVLNAAIDELIEAGRITMKLIQRSSGGRAGRHYSVRER